MECVIYNIITKDGLYIGSTTNFKNRCWEHKSNLKRNISYPVYKNIRANNGQYKIEIILELVCEDKTELRKIEEEYRILCGANLNGQSAFNTEDEKLEYFINYKQINKELRIKNNTEKVKCLCGGKYTYSNKIQHYKTKKHQAYLASL
tara:strand:+ start:122 stop:565 length:444 start_codon:yes stop_codon:yes gene_type:complete